MRTCDVTSVRAEYLDCCLPDYFCGSSAQEVLAVPMRPHITYKEAYDEAKDNFHTSSGYFDDVSGSGTLVEEALHSMFSGIEDVNKEADFAKYIEESEDDCCESVYLYIGLFAECES